MKSTIRCSAFLSCLLLILSSYSQAQSDSSPAKLSGKLTDVAGYGIAAVHVVATSEGDNSSPTYQTSSNLEGVYSLSLPSGRYQIHFEHPAFVRQDLSAQLTPGESRVLDIRMTIAPLSDKVVVTANAQPLELSQMPAPVDLVTREEIDQRQLVSLPDALVTTPGATIARTGREGGLTTFFLDGGDSNFTKFLVDGTPLNEPGGFLNLANSTLDNIDKIEIVHGAESALYGTDAVSGVVQLFSHRGETRVPEINLFTEGGSFSSARGGAQFSGLLGPFDYSAAGSYFQTDGQGPNDAFLNRSFAGNFGYRFTETDGLRLTIHSNSSFAGVPGPTLLEPPSLSQNEDLKILLVNLAWNFQTGTHWQHTLNAFENRTLDTNANPPFFTSTDQFNVAGFRQQSTYSFRKGAVAAGYEYQVENGYPSTLGGQHARRNNQAGFLDARWVPVPRLTLSAGLRAEDNTTFGTRVVPRAGAVYALRYASGFFGDTRARFSYGQGFKEPSLDQSFGSDPCFPGNNTLKPEQSRTFDAGIDQFLASDRLRLSATYFNNRFRDIVSFAFDSITTPACPFGTGTFFNTDLARARGANFSGDFRPRRWLGIKANYSYDDTRVLQAPNAFASVELPGNHLLRRPVNSGSVILNAGVRHWNLSVTGYFTGIRTDSDFLGFGITHNPGYARFDAAGSYEFGHGLSLYCRATNLFDKQYQDAVGFPALGRDVRVGMNYRFRGKD